MPSASQLILGPLVPLVRSGSHFYLIFVHICHKGFGSTGAFGQPAQQQPQANPMFGSTANTGTTGAFGGGGKSLVAFARVYL